MHTGKRYRLMEVLVWTKRELLAMTLIAIIPVVLYAGLGWTWLEIPWVPVAMLGTASAFTVGFRNNATYSRTWEARQIWGGIVNASRTFALMARDLPRGASADEDHDTATAMVHTHIAWLTALRYQLREPRVWENMDRADNLAFQQRYYAVPERDGALQPSLERLLAPADVARVMSTANKATSILGLQSARVRALARRGALDTIGQTAMLRQLAELLDCQGRCERIKNFPYPRQFATLNYWFIRLFVWLVPFGMLHEFQSLEGVKIWLTIPFSLIVTWLFLALEKVGESTENPFEGSANDVPITALSRTIEIDLRQLLDESEIPAPLTATHSILM
jgi:ion channel-forming bestrophin family protein